MDEKHIIEMAFDLFDNIEYRDPKRFYPWAKEQIQDDEKYYFLLYEVQLLDEFAHSRATDKAEFPDYNKFEIMSDGMVYLFVRFAQGCKKCSLHLHMREC